MKQVLAAVVIGVCATSGFALADDAISTEAHQLIAMNTLASTRIEMGEVIGNQHVLQPVATVRVTDSSAQATLNNVSDKLSKQLEQQLVKALAQAE